VPLRIGARTYARSDSGVPAPPFLWLESGVELGTTQARTWTASFLVGYSFIPQAYQGILAQSRVQRILTGTGRSLTHPDVYGFLGVAAISVWGAATSPFQTDPLTADDLLTATEGTSPRTTFGAIQVGLDLRVRERIGASVFLETMPALSDNDNFDDYLVVADIGFQGLGTEVSFWF